MADVTIPVSIVNGNLTVPNKTVQLNETIQWVAETDGLTLTEVSDPNSIFTPSPGTGNQFTTTATVVVTNQPYMVYADYEQPEAGDHAMDKKGKEVSADITINA